MGMIAGQLPISIVGAVASLVVAATLEARQQRIAHSKARAVDERPGIAIGNRHYDILFGCHADTFTSRGNVAVEHYWLGRGILDQLCHKSALSEE